MKPIVIVLALLAAAKLGHQEYLFRTATRDTIVRAYRERAIQACQKDAGSASGRLPAGLEPTPTPVKLAIGKGGLDVHFWQVDNEQWNSRYRNPYLLISGGPALRPQARCEYDIVNLMPPSREGASRLRPQKTR